MTQTKAADICYSQLDSMWVTENDALRVKELGKQLSDHIAEVNIYWLKKVAAKHYVLVARNGSDGPIVGMARMVVDYSFFRGGIVGIEEFAVDPDFCGRGIGSAMLQKLKYIAWYKGATRMRLNCSDRRLVALELCKSRNFRQIDTNFFILDL